MATETQAYAANPGSAPAACSPLRLSVAELGEKYRNEEAHAAHVAALALTLFDATHEALGVPIADRRLLEAACRLHDVGHRSSPRRHAAMGAEIVQREGLAGFTPAERRCIATVIRRHALRGRGVARATAGWGPSASGRVLRLAAYLRIGDSLDCSHVQDAAILGVRVTARQVRVVARCRLFPPGLARAARRAESWRAVFGRDLLLVPARRRAAPLLMPGLAVGEVARRLLYLHFRWLLWHAEGAVAAVDGEALHELRIALRRVRALLRALRKPLAGTSADRLAAALQRLNRALGPARDLDAWLEFLDGRGVKAGLARHRRWAPFLAHQQELRRLQQPTVRRQLRGPAFAALRFAMERFLRVELPAAFAAAPAHSLEPTARRVLARGLRRVTRLAALRQARSLDRLHRLRIALRRLRYLGHFFAPVLDRPVAQLTKRAHAVERTLGEIRDTGLALARIRSEGPPPPQLLVARLERHHRAARAQLGRLWRRFEDPALAAAVQATLEK